MAMYTLKGIGEISTDAFDEKITLKKFITNHFSFMILLLLEYKTKLFFSI